MRVRRFAAAGAVSAVTAAAVYPLFFTVIAVLGDRGEVAKNAGFGLFFFGAALLVSSLHVLLLGVPAVLLLERWKALNYRNLALAGFLGGALPAAVLSNLEDAPWAGLFGLIGASAFWLVWSRAGSPKRRD